MMTKPISRWRNVIYGLMVIPICILLVSCFGDYEILNPHPLIQSNGDIIAVDIRKMNPDQIELARAKLKQFNIDLTVKNIKYDGNEFMTNLTVHADFNNGNTAKESFNSTCTGGIQFPYGIWKNLETGESGIGWPVDFEVSNQSADSPSSRPIADSYIDYISQDKFSVNFKGMTSEQVDAVQKEVEGKGISLFYNKLGFNTAGLINMIQFTFEMGRGNSRSATFAFSQSQLNNSPPFGFWINKKAGTSGTGTLSIEGNITKAILYDNVSLEQYKGASFFIEDKQVSFKEVKGWLEEHNWISNTISYEPSNKVYRFTLPDSSN